jgi:hypothetical protein
MYVGFIPEQLAASQGGLSSMELVSWFYSSNYDHMKKI